MPAAGCRTTDVRDSLPERGVAHSGQAREHGVFGLVVPKVEVAHRDDRIPGLQRSDTQLYDLARPVAQVGVGDVARVAGVKVGIEDRNGSRVGLQAEPDESLAAVVVAVIDPFRVSPQRVAIEAVGLDREARDHEQAAAVDGGAGAPGVREPSTSARPPKPPLGSRGPYFLEGHHVDFEGCEPFTDRF